MMLLRFGEQRSEPDWREFSGHVEHAHRGMITEDSLLNFITSIKNSFRASRSIFPLLISQYMLHPTSIASGPSVETLKRRICFRGVFVVFYQR